MAAFDILLYSALFVCIAGLVYRIGSWFVQKVGISGEHVPVARRAAAACKAFFQVVFSLNALKLLQVIVVDVVFQRRILVKAGFFRWAAHMLIFYGFLFLLLMHALDDVVSSRLFSDYYSTINPFLFLRSIFATMVAAGILMAVGRRLFSAQTRVKTTRNDAYAIFIVAFIIFSGVFLEGLTMTSHSEFERMLEDYAGLYDEDEIRALESYWVENFALVSPAVSGPFDAELLSSGQEVSDSYCMSCHVSNKWGFLGYGSARIIRPAAVWLDQNSGVSIFWYVHIISCFLGLAILPFTKMFHMVSVPVSMAVSAVRAQDALESENLATINAMEIDACTHCGVCSQTCSAAVMSVVIGNEYILPSEKMRALKKLRQKRKTTPTDADAVRQGIYLCTSCDRCTAACPSGIRLKDLWINVRESLIQTPVPETVMLSPFSFVRGLARETLSVNDEKAAYENPVNQTLRAVCGNGRPALKDDDPIVLTGKEPDQHIEKLTNAVDYGSCFDCRNCSSICPVVGNYENPEAVLGMLPHQIMCSLGLNLIEPAAAAKMLWYCLTCYLCQEHCPEKVPVCDHLYSLKNFAVNKFDVPVKKSDSDGKEKSSKFKARKS